jgi:hypothetical protein
MLAPAQAFLTERRPLASLADIIEPWRRLAANAAEPNVFHEPGFALAAAPVLGRGCRLEAARRRGIAWARGVRDFLRRPIRRMG